MGRFAQSILKGSESTEKPRTVLWDSTFARLFGSELYMPSCFCAFDFLHSRGQAPFAPSHHVFELALADWIRKAIHLLGCVCKGKALETVICAEELVGIQWTGPCTICRFWNTPGILVVWIGRCCGSLNTVQWYLSRLQKARLLYRVAWPKLRDTQSEVGTFLLTGTKEGWAHPSEVQGLRSLSSLQWVRPCFKALLSWSPGVSNAW